MQRNIVSFFLVNNNEIKTNDGDDEKECNEEWNNQVI